MGFGCARWMGKLDRGCMIILVGLSFLMCEVMKMMKW